MIYGVESRTEVQENEQGETLFHRRWSEQGHYGLPAELFQSNERIGMRTTGLAED